MVDIMKCQRCKAPLVGSSQTDHFLYCSMECKELLAAERLERMRKELLTHRPQDRHVKTPGELRALRCGAPTGEKPRTKPKGKRKCGKCGASGHNARTCTQGKNGDTKRHAYKKRSLNTCGRCGGKGHNARTCAKRA